MPRLALFPRTERRPLSRRRGGFSLPELLVVITILGIIGAALTRTLVKQGQVYKDANRTATMRRELRMGATMLPQDVRSISSSGGDVMEMDERRFTFLNTYGSAIICARTANTFDVLPTNLAKNTLTTWTSYPQVGDTIFAYNDSLTTGAVDDAWQKLAITAVAQNTATCPGGPYADPVLDPPATKPRIRFTVLSATGGNLADSVKVGAVVRFTRPARYELYQSTGTGSWYLAFSDNSNGTWSAPQILSGPYRPFVSGDGNPSGLQFRYYDSTGTRLNNIAQKLQLSRLDVYLRAANGNSSVTERRGAAMLDSTFFRIALRNYK